MNESHDVFVSVVPAMLQVDLVGAAIIVDLLERMDRLEADLLRLRRG